MTQPRKDEEYQSGTTPRHGRTILVLQWFAVVIFTTLVVVPAFLLLLVLSSLAYRGRAPAQASGQASAVKMR